MIWFLEGQSSQRDIILGAREALPAARAVHILRQVLAALNVGAQAARVSVEQLQHEFLPVLQRGAQELAVLLP